MRIYTIVTLMLFCGLVLSAQNIPIDFEENGNGADWTWRTFENGSDPILEIITNPDSSGINTSSTVAKFTALQIGQAFAGCESTHGEDIGSFTINSSNAVIRIMVWKSVISDVGIKLVRSDNWSLGEIKIPNTKVNEWEQLVFDFSEHIGNSYDQIVIFPDFEDRPSDNVIYFDNVYGEEAVLSSSSDIEDANFHVYPNPATNRINIEGDINLESYSISSISGQSLVRRKDLNDQGIVNISNLKSGVYILHLQSQGRSFQHIFVKE